MAEEPASSPTRERVYAYFREACGFAPGEPLADVRLRNVIDSLGVLSLITFIEDEFKVRVETEMLTEENFGTPGLVAGYVERCLARAA